MSTQTPHADQHFIHALLHNDAQAVEEIYRRFSPRVKQYVTQNSGTADDAADIFQESLVDIYNQARYKNLMLPCLSPPLFNIRFPRLSTSSTFLTSLHLPYSFSSNSLALS